MAGKLSRSHSLTRSSLKAKGRNKRKKADSFDTMMTGDDGDAGQQEQAQDEEEKPVKRLCSDPMARFDPELSMDGVANEEDNDQEDSEAKSKSSFSFFDEVSCQGITTASSSGGAKKKKKEQKPVNFLTYKANSMGGSSRANLVTNRSVDQGWLDRCAGAGDTDSDMTYGNKSPAPVSFSNLLPKASTSTSKEQAKKSSLSLKDNKYSDESPREDVAVQTPPSESVTKPKASGSKKKVDKDQEREEIDSDVDFIVSEGEEESLLELEKPQAKRKRSKTEQDECEAPNSSDIYALGFEEPEEGCSSNKATNFGKGGKRAFASMSQEDRLRHKLKSDNFVKINLKKKTYVKGRKTMTGSKYRRMEFKRKMAEKEGKGGAKKRNCFRCGEEGHWANECTGTSDKLMPEVEDGGEGDFPTLEEAADMARGLSLEAKVPSERANVFGKEKTGEEDMFANEEDEDAFLLRACAEWQPEELPADSFDLLNKVPPYFSPDDSDEDCLDKMRSTLKKLFDFEDFRHGQAQAALRILRGESTLVLLSTGAGKSLIYQLPAYLYAERSECITIVVSPLVSLMEDQVVGLPSGLRAACLHSNLTETQRGKVVDLIKRRRLHFLLISPEALAGGGGGGGGFFSSLIRDLPPIAFVCIDEAHCVSQWSHNFRPAYLRLCRVIRERLGVRTILGLTATAPESTVKDVAEHLSVDPDAGVIRGELMPKNLVLSVSKDEDRERALIRLLEGPRFAQCDSIIVYCTRRETCERLAALIRTSMQSEDLKKKEDGAAGTKGSRRKGLSLTAEPYHAGMSAYKRKSVQNKSCLDN